jgi:hypothetical protein
MPKAAPTTAKNSLQLPLDSNGRLIIDSEAAEMVRSISEQWQLSPAIAGLLRTASEQLTTARCCDRVVAEEGLSFRDKGGGLRGHPLATLAATLRTSASAALSKVHQALS